MWSPFKKSRKKVSSRKGAVSNKVRDYGSETFFVEKAEASKKTIQKYGLPGQLTTGKSK